MSYPVPSGEVLLVPEFLHILDPCWCEGLYCCGLGDAKTL